MLKPDGVADENRRDARGGIKNRLVEHPASVPAWRLRGESGGRRPRARGQPPANGPQRPMTTRALDDAHIDDPACPVTANAGGSRRCAGGRGDRHGRR